MQTKTMGHHKKTQAFIYFCLALCSAFGYYTCARKLLSERPSIAAARRQLPQHAHKSVTRVFFSPDDDIREILLGLIAAEQQAIHVAIFSFTDPELSQALIDAHKRGIKIEIIADRTNATSSWSKIKLLGKHKIPLYLYPADITDTIMHDKIMLFAQTIDNKQLICTGSYNFTRSAASNQENMLIIEDSELYQAYQKQFTLLKERSVLTNPACIKIVQNDKRRRR